MVEREAPFLTPGGHSPDSSWVQHWDQNTATETTCPGQAFPVPPHPAWYPQRINWPERQFPKDPLGLI